MIELSSVYKIEMAYRFTCGKSENLSHILLSHIIDIIPYIIICIICLMQVLSFGSISSLLF